MRLANPPAHGSKYAEVIKTEEKGSDVNLASYLLLDAFNGEYDRAVVISADSDLCRPIEMVVNHFKKEVFVCFDHGGRGHAVKRSATAYRPIRNGALASSQFPPTLTDARGTITKPTSW